MKIRNPKLHIDSNIQLISVPVLDGKDLILKQIATGNFESVALKNEEVDDSFIVSINAEEGFEVYDLVNCSFDMASDNVYITDPSQDASCTIHESES